MPVDVYVEFVPLSVNDDDEDDGHAVREKLAREFEVTRLDNVKLMCAVEVGGGTDFSSGVCDAQFEAKNAQDAQVAAAVIALSLLKQGFIVRPGGPNDTLIARQRIPVLEPDPGEAYITVVAPLGA